MKCTGFLRSPEYSSSSLTDDRFRLGSDTAISARTADGQGGPTLGQARGLLSAPMPVFWDRVSVRTAPSAINTLRAFSRNLPPACAINSLGRSVNRLQAQIRLQWPHQPDGRAAIGPAATISRGRHWTDRTSNQLLHAPGLLRNKSPRWDRDLRGRDRRRGEQSLPDKLESGERGSPLRPPEA